MEKKNIYRKLLECKKQIGTVAKNAKNPHFKNTYADLNALIEAVEPILLENGLVMLQPIIEGKQFTVIHDTESGESVESYLELNSSLPPQAQGSAITYFRRYTLQSLLSLKADDDDGHNATNVKPPFTVDKFEQAHKVNATVEQIKQKYTITEDVRKAYVAYVESNTK